MDEMKQNVDEMNRTTAELRRQHRAAGIDFINTELDLAITFCESANSTSSSARADRNIINAKNAYYSAMRFIEMLKINEDPDGERQVIREKLTTLRACLEQLGETV
jgi:hypothetical protein